METRKSQVLRPAHNVSIRSIPYEGEVGAGRIIPFVPKGEVVDMPVPDEISETEPLGAMKVSGVSLERLGIYNRDIVLVRKVFNRKKITRDTVCILWVEPLGEVVAKKVTFKKGKILLHYCGRKPQLPLEIDAKDVQFRGIVIGVNRPQTEWPFIDEIEAVAVNGNGQPMLSQTEKAAKIAEVMRHLKPVKSYDKIPR